MCVNADQLWDEEQDGYFLDNPKKPTDEETLVHHTFFSTLSLNILTSLDRVVRRPC